MRGDKETLKGILCTSGSCLDTQSVRVGEGVGMDKETMNQAVSG